MKPLSAQTKILTLATIAIALFVCGWFIRRDGIQLGRIDQKIQASADRVKGIEAAVTAADPVAKAEVKKAIAKRVDYRAARAKVEVKGDSVIADGQRAEMPSVAAALEKADGMSVQDSTAIREQARSDTLKNVLVGALDHHVDLLEEAKRPRCSTKCGIVIGTAATITVVYIGVRIIQALGHR